MSGWIRRSLTTWRTMLQVYFYTRGHHFILNCQHSILKCRHSILKCHHVIDDAAEAEAAECEDDACENTVRVKAPCCLLLAACCFSVGQLGKIFVLIRNLLDRVLGTATATRLLPPLQRSPTRVAAMATGTLPRTAATGTAPTPSRRRRSTISQGLGLSASSWRATLTTSSSTTSWGRSFAR